MARLNRFYTPRENIREGSSVKLEAEDANHIRKTLRLSQNDEIIVFNGEKEFKARIKIASNDFVMVQLKEQLREKDFSKEKHLDFTIIQGIIKASNFEMILEKCTELGATNFIPLGTEYSQIPPERIISKYQRWNKIIVSACKQSERIDIPTLSQPIRFNELFEIIKQNHFDVVYVLALENRKESNNSDIVISTKFNHLEDKKNIAVIVGPEGGFSPKEYQQLSKQKDIQFIQINDHILRAETAAIVASGIVKYSIL